MKRMMYRWVCNLLVVLGLFGCSGASVTEQAKILGNENFSKSGWMAANQVERGKMVASFLAQHDLKTLSAEGVKELLGPPTGYYDYDENPAYLIGPSTVEGIHGKGYLLAFVADKASGKIIDLKIIPEPRK